MAREYRETQKAATQVKVDAFCAAYGNPDQVNLLREQAKLLMGHMNAALVAEKEIEITAKKNAELIKKLQDGPGKWEAALHGLYGNILTGIVVGIFAFLAMTSKYGLVGAAGMMFGWEKKAQILRLQQVLHPIRKHNPNSLHITPLS